MYTYYMLGSNPASIPYLQLLPLFLHHFSLPISCILSFVKCPLNADKAAHMCMVTGSFTKA